MYMPKTYPDLQALDYSRQYAAAIGDSEAIAKINNLKSPL